MSDTAVGTVKCWEETITIPTYAVGKPDKNPMFLEKRVYQGSSGAVYPYPVIDSIANESHLQEYVGIFIENRYLRVLLLPQLGGRVYMALDKTNNYHFVYYNRVIKPALVGLAGPWISGGIEFNWPQHHRPSTFSPVDYLLQANPDGSQTVWFSEIERMFRTKGMVGFTLYPDAAFIELNVQLYNRTDKPQTFLWWANPAVHVNDNYQSVFPPDVHAVMDHGKRAVSDFPIATGTYYKVNYAPGTDISRYKNIAVPTSFMAYHSDFDFIGCYDHGRQAGMMHVANHHLVPGKKQWTWGCGDFGASWDQQLTDEDGPYIELMCGAFTDNQPDFSWLQPGEQKHFTQVFMPYKAIGAAKNASREAVINLEVSEGCSVLGVYVTRPRRVRVVLMDRETTLFEHEAHLSPEQALIEKIPVSAPASALTLNVYAHDGALLIGYAPPPDSKPPIPAPAAAAPSPDLVATNDELFLHGLHLEQYRHATYAPEPYYEEALKRDPGDYRCNHALGLLLLRRGKFAMAETFFRRSLARLTMRNANPYDGEVSYHLGLALCMQERFAEAYDCFYKAVWNAPVRASSLFELARIDCRRGDFARALTHARDALTYNTHHHQARHLEIICLRKLNREAEAVRSVEESLERDPFNFGALYELELLTGGRGSFGARTRGWLNTYLEIALDYARAGLFEEARALLEAAPQLDPLAWYCAAWFSHQLGDSSAVERYLNLAAQTSLDYCFPNVVECVSVLEWAANQRRNDASAPYLLGCFWYAHRRYEEAISAWECSAERNPLFPTVHRNLGLAYMNKRGDAARALDAYERAFQLDPSDARILYELDQLRKKTGTPPDLRLNRLLAYPDLIQRRDDLLIETVTCLNLTGQHTRALDLLNSHIFHPWEGGEGKATEQYTLALLQLARQDLQHGIPDQAIARLKAAQRIPANLNEGRLEGARNNHIAYTLGLAYMRAEDRDAARQWFEAALAGANDVTEAMYYNDQPPDMLFYKGLACRELGLHDQARELFMRMIVYGQAHMEESVAVDYFAVSLPNFLVFDDDLAMRHRLHCHYMLALGHLGLGDMTTAARHFSHILERNPSHVGAVIHADWAQKGSAE